MGDEGQDQQVKIGTVKWVGSMVLAALVSYFGTTFGMQARIDVLESRVRLADASPAKLDALTNEVSVLSQRVAVLTAIVERIESRQNAGRR